MYSPELLDHAMNPRNFGRLVRPDRSGSSSFEHCGDRMSLQFQLAEGRILDVVADACGCGPTMAAASVATELLKGRTVDEARRLDPAEIDAALGRVPAVHRHAFWMVLECVEEAFAMDSS